MYEINFLDDRNRGVDVPVIDVFVIFLFRLRQLHLEHATDLAGSVLVVEIVRNVMESKFIQLHSPAALPPDRVNIQERRRARRQYTRKETVGARCLPSSSRSSGGELLNTMTNVDPPSRLS